MTIAVNTRFLLPDYKEGFGNYIYEVFIRVTGKNPMHQFIFLYDTPQTFDEAWPSNVQHIVIGPAARHPLLWKWWYDYRIPYILKKIKADLFFSPDGFCSLGTKVPQCMVIHDLAWLHYPRDIKSSHFSFYKKYTQKFIRQSRTIITVSEFSKKDIITHYPEATGKIEVIHNGVKEIFRVLDDTEKKTTREKYTDGKEYFFYAGAIHPRKNLVNLLKAFSIFKKRQQSGIKLVLTGRMAWKNDQFLNDLKTYKYRNDVIVTGYIADKDLVMLMGSAYAFVYPSYWEGFGMPVTEAMRSGIPVITTKNSAMEEIAGDAALYADPAQPVSIAEQMILLYKDERLRKLMIEKGSKLQASYSWDLAAERISEILFRQTHDVTLPAKPHS